LEGDSIFKKHNIHIVLRYLISLRNYVLLVIYIFFNTISYYNTC